MGMRETEGSLKAYFIVAGVLGALVTVNDLNGIGAVSSLLPASWKLPIYAHDLVRIALSVGFIIAGARLKAELPRGARWIQQLLLLGLVMQLGTTIWLGALIGGQVPGLYIPALVGMLITAYLLHNLRRLAAEAMARSIPPAKIV